MDHPLDARRPPPPAARLLVLLLPALTVGVVLAAALMAPAPAVAQAQPSTPVGAAPAAGPDRGALALYDRLCLPCHGHGGDGRGPATPWLWPAPRDFAAGYFKWKWHAAMSGPSDDDLARTIRWGAPGTSMHGFSLDPGQLAGLVTVVRSFAARSPTPAAAPEGTPALVVPPAPAGPSDPARGAALWKSAGCVACHGEAGRGDGPAAPSLRDVTGGPHPPYDLTVTGVRRPRADGSLAARRRAVVETLLAGVSGTAMPSFAQVLPADDLYTLADHVLALAPAAPPADRTLTAPAAIAADRVARMPAGTWPGHGAPDEAALFGGTIRFQGPAPAELAPAQASLSSQQCTRCHAKQAREWTGSLHSLAASPGLIAQIVRIGERGAMSADEVESCQRCHAPLAEQLPMVRPGHSGGDDAARAYVANPGFDAALRAEGVSCAACHVRDHVRHGPPVLAPSLLGLPVYPLRQLALYERADFCLPCHQLQPRLAVAGRPLLNTYREWLEGPYMRRGVQCQHCHMPNREHTFRGVHDPDTFRQGLTVSATAVRGASGAVTVRALARNTGAGHYLPTTPTPAAWLRSELVDADGRVIAGTQAERRIGRKIAYTGGAWRDLEDTRIPPGEALELAAAWQRGRVAAATRAVITVEVHPDDYYEGLYQARLKKQLAPEVRALFQDALARARASYYQAYRLEVPITERR